MAEINTSIEVSSINSAADAMERLGRAVDGLAEALRQLEGAGHGGVVFKMVGEIVHCEVKPPAGGSSRDERRFA